MHERRRDPHLSLGPIRQVNQERKGMYMDMLEKCVMVYTSERSGPDTAQKVRDTFSKCMW